MLGIPPTTPHRRSSRAQNCCKNIMAMEQLGAQTMSGYSSRLRRIALLLGVTVQVCFVLAGCFRDPNIRKQRFVEEGDRYFAQEKYPEALLTYGRALQIDPRFAAAHYKIAKCHLKLANWASAFQELRRTIDLEPQNLPAHLDLGQLYLAGSKTPEARDQAKLI